MARYMIPIPTIAGLLTSQAGQAFTITTPAGALTAIRADLTATDAGSADTVVTIGDGTATETVTIAAGNKYVTHDFSDVWAAGAPLTLTVVSGDAMNLSGLLLVDDAEEGAQPAGLVSLVDVKSALGITGASAEDDDYLNRQINLVSERARSYTGRHLNAALHAETFYAPEAVTLHAFPISSISSVDQDGTALVAADVRFDPSTGRLWRPQTSNRFDWRDVETLTVNYTAGYNPIPAGIAEWAYIAIQAGWDAWPADRGIAPGGQVPRAINFPGAGSVEFETRGVNNPWVPDWLARAPMSALDPWVDMAARYSDEYSIYQRLP